MTQQQYEQITVSSLCEKMQIPRKSFYRYFSSKEGALNALIDQTLLDFESFSSTGREDSGSLRETLERLFAFWLHNRKLLDALEKSGLSGVLVHRAIGLSLFESGREWRFLPQEEKLAQEYMMLFAISGLMSMVIQWHHDGYPQTVQQMAAIARRLMENPLSADLLFK